MFFLPLKYSPSVVVSSFPAGVFLSIACLTLPTLVTSWSASLRVDFARSAPRIGA
jgi:hypothetical protein